MSSKDKCPNCNKEYTKKTLAKYNGKCRKCNMISSNNTVEYSDEMKQECWDKYDNFENNCYVCGNYIYKHDFHLGHTLPKYDKKELTVDNVKLICKPCYVVCGTQNIDDYKKKMNSPNTFTHLMNAFAGFTK